MAKRNRLEIIRDMLRLVHQNKNSILKTPLLRKSNLSSQRFSEYYQEILNRGLIIEKANKKGKLSISLTDKGYRYLDKYNQIIEFIDEFDL